MGQKEQKESVATMEGLPGIKSLKTWRRFSVNGPDQQDNAAIEESETPLYSVFKTHETALERSETGLKDREAGIRVVSARDVQLFLQRVYASRLGATLGGAARRVEDNS